METGVCILLFCVIEIWLTEIYDEWRRHVIIPFESSRMVARLAVCWPRVYGTLIILIYIPFSHFQSVLNPTPLIPYGNVCAQKHKKNKCIRVKLLCVVFVYIDNIHLFWFCFVVRSKLYIVCLHSPRLEISMRPVAPSIVAPRTHARAHRVRTRLRMRSVPYVHTWCVLSVYALRKYNLHGYTTNILTYINLVCVVPWLVLTITLPSTSMIIFIIFLCIIFLLSLLFMIWFYVIFLYTYLDVQDDLI